MSLSPQERAQWQKANALFDRFLEERPDDPGQWLKTQSPDQEVGMRVEQLIAAHQKTQSPLDHSLAQWMPDEDNNEDTDALSGRQIGQWVLLEALGRGGMATVYRARRDTTDFDQVAAIKLMNVGLISSRLREHFNREQQILAGLAHPHIASLLDAGVADDGTPYIVMDYVDGQPIDRFVQSQSLTRPAVVSLFLQVCDAVAFAQQNLIVHRDIKPSNILVDANHQARLLDFGIARLVEDDDGDATTTRAFTPGYAAPEQKAGATVTTATDVFGLGMVLFELLTGARADTDEDGNLRGDQLVSLRKRDADLANIVAMAIRPEPERRYASASGLAQDLRLWKTDRPILASPDSNVYRLGKFMKRNRAGVVAAALVALITVVGVSTTAWQARQTQKALVTANANASQAQAVQDFLLEMFDGADPWTNQNEPLTANDLLDTALEKLPQSLTEHPEQKASVMLALTQILRNLGRHEESIVQAEQATELFLEAGNERQAFRSRLLLGAIFIDVLDQERGEQVLTALVADTDKPELVAESIEARTLLARLYTLTGGNLEKQTEMVQAVQADLPKIIDQPGHAALVGEVYTTIAENFENRGEYEKAFETAVESESWLTEAHGANHAFVANALTFQSTASFEMGQWDQAEEALVRAINIFDNRYPERHPTILWAQYQLGRTLLEGGRYERALKHYKSFYQTCVDQLGSQDPRTIMAHINLGISYKQLGQLDQAHSELSLAVPILVKNSGDHPKAGVGLVRWSEVMSELGETAKAETTFDQGFRLLERVVGKDHPLYARGQVLLAKHQLRHGEALAAIDTLEQSLPVLTKAYGDDQEFVWEAQLQQGLALAELDQTDRALELISASISSLSTERYEQKYRGELTQARQVQVSLQSH